MFLVWKNWCQVFVIANPKLELMMSKEDEQQGESAQNVAH